MTTTLPSCRYCSTRWVLISLMKALEWTAFVIKPDWNPVMEMASTPRACRAMAIRLTVWISPVESRASISRLEGVGFTSLARAIKRLVVLPMAEQTTTSLCPCCRS